MERIYQKQRVKRTKKGNKVCWTNNHKMWTQNNLATEKKRNTIKGSNAIVYDMRRIYFSWNMQKHFYEWILSRFSVYCCCLCSFVIHFYFLFQFAATSLFRQTKVNANSFNWFKFDKKCTDWNHSYRNNNPF